MMNMIRDIILIIIRLNKNRDPINDTVVDLLKKSKTCTLMNEIYMDHPGQTKEEEDLPPPGHRRGKKRVVVKSKTAAKMANFKTVCSYFRDQLNNLINMLMSTEPSFIRCIVPNNHKKPGDLLKTCFHFFFTIFNFSHLISVSQIFSNFHITNYLINSELFST